MAGTKAYYSRWGGEPSCLLPMTVYRPLADTCRPLQTLADPNHGTVELHMLFSEAPAVAKVRGGNPVFITGGSPSARTTQYLTPKRERKKQFHGGAHQEANKSPTLTSGKPIYRAGTWVRGLQPLTQEAPLAPPLPHRIYLLPHRSLGPLHLRGYKLILRNR